MKNYLYMKLEKGEGEVISNVEMRLEDSSLELPFEVFAERYVRPAYKQLIAEQKYRLEHPAPPADSPR